LILFAKKKKLKHIGMIIAGFGILFLGMRIMSDAMRPLSNEPWVVDLFRFAENPWIGIAIGFVITAVIQSSTAAMGVLLAAAMSGMVTDLNQAIFILYGQNIGTCLTVIISSIGSSKITKKAALIHLVYKTVGIAIIVIITLLPIGFVSFIEGLSYNVTTQLVYAHIIINVLMAIMLLPFSNGIVKITEMIIRGEDEKRSDEDFEYIDTRLLSTPSLAVVQAYEEVERYAKMAFDNFVLVKDVVVNDNHVGETIYENENHINNLGRKINKHLTKLTATELEYVDVKLVSALYRITMGIERMGNHAVNIVKAYESLKEEGQKFSTEAMSELNSMFDNTEKALSKAIKIFESGQYNERRALEVKKLETEIDDQNVKYNNNHIERLNGGVCAPLASVAFIKILTELERIADYACSISYSTPKS